MVYQHREQTLIFTNQVGQSLDAVIRQADAPNVFVLTDTNTTRNVLPLLRSASERMASAVEICIKPGDVNKNLDSLTRIWTALQKQGATRRTVLVNAGGGMVSDIGGFAAATFKRGIPFINVPTTLLAAVDAAVGGKTGINFQGYKNEIGTFCPADTVIISTVFFGTLPKEELLSGYAEMIKHGLIQRHRQSYYDLLDYDPSQAECLDELLPLLQKSVEVKRRIVQEDPFEKGIRRALNFGHTVGHAFESLAMQRKCPVPHGYAVAWGCVAGLVISHLQKGFPSNELQRLAKWVETHYGTFFFDCSDYDALIDLMRHDKKNLTPGSIAFTLLSDIGCVHTGCVVRDEEVRTALDIYRDLMHI